MYDNIGSKIKSLAKATFIIEAIAAVITGIVFIAEDPDMILISFLIMFLGPIVAWVASWLLYGFGQLIENSDIIAEEHKRVNEKHEKSVIKNNARELKRNAEKEAQRREKVKVTIANPDVDDNEFIDITCQSCKAELCYTKEQLQNPEALTCPMCDAPISL